MWVYRACGDLVTPAVNTAAPDEGNMYLLAKLSSDEQKERFLKPLVAGYTRSAFFMTEPAAENGAGSDPSMMKTTAQPDGHYWVINGRKTFITGAEGATLDPRGSAGRFCLSRDDVSGARSPFHRNS